MKHYIHTAVVAALVAGLITLLAPRHAETPAPAAAKQESAYERVMRTGTIRCGYFNYAPVFSTDANTGARSGIFYEIFEELGHALNLKIEWAQEINLATYLEDMNAGRYDLECSGGWPNGQRALRILYSAPLYYGPIYAYAKAGDDRFAKGNEVLNNPELRLVAVEGEYAEQMRRRQFPQSPIIVLGPGSYFADLAQNIESGKANWLVSDRATFLDYEKKNPGKLVQVKGPPLRLNTFNIGIPRGEAQLQNALNAVIAELQHEGVVDRILKKYEIATGAFLRVASPLESNSP